MHEDINEARRIIIEVYDIFGVHEKWAPVMAERIRGVNVSTSTPLQSIAWLRTTYPFRDAFIKDWNDLLQRVKNKYPNDQELLRGLKRMEN